jgi:hypothetical protein
LGPGKDEMRIGEEKKRRALGLCELACLVARMTVNVDVDVDVVRIVAVEHLLSACQTLPAVPVSYQKAPSPTPPAHATTTTTTTSLQTTRKETTDMDHGEQSTSSFRWTSPSLSLSHHP